MEKKCPNVVYAIIRDGDKILCTQRLRKGPNYIAEHWESPGDEVNEGGSDHEALRHKILEEVDWDIYVGVKLGSVRYDYPDFSICFIVYDCMAYGDDFKLLAHIDSCWLKPEEFSRFNWVEANAALTKQLWE